MSDSEDSGDDRWGRRRKKERKRNKSPKPYRLKIEELIKQHDRKEAERHARETKHATAADDVSSDSNSALQALLQTPQLADDLLAFDACGFTLPWAAREGCAPAIASLLNRAPDPAALIDAPDGTGRTALSWAAGEGHGAAVSGLLERGASLVTEDSRGRTPLTWAAANGHVTTAGLLLDHHMRTKGSARIANDDGSGREGDSGDSAAPITADAGYVNSPCAQGRSPLSWAAGNGHEGVVRVLLAQGGAVMDLEDIHGARPLAWAAAGGHRLVVLRLFQWVEERVDEAERVENPEYVSKFTALYWARSHARGEEILPIFVRHGLNLNAQDQRGRTALEMAATAGCVAVTMLLLKHGADADNQNAVGRTPLIEAAARGYDKVVRLLLRKEEGGGKADAELEDEDGETALSLAAYAGHDALVQLLSEAIHQDPFQRSERESLFWWALKHSDGGDAMAPLVQALLEDGIDPNTPGDKDGQHPLIWAAASGYEAVVTALLTAKSINLEYQDKWKAWHDKNKTHDWGSGLTPLGWAARNNHTGIVARLLARGAAVEAAGTGGETPLAWAAGKGNIEAVELLLEHGAELHLFEMRTGRSSSSDGDRYKHTPLREAVAKRHWNIARILVERAVDDVCAQRAVPLPTSAKDKWGYELDRLTYWEGRSELSWAAQIGHVEAVRRLLLLPATLSPWPSSTMFPSASKFAVNSRDSSQRTPLLMASKEGHAAVVELLLTNGASASLADSNRKTPLWEAAANGHAAIVAQLLKHCKVSDVWAVDEYEKNTPLHKAAQGGHLEVADLLLDYAADLGDKKRGHSSSGERMEVGDAKSDDDGDETREEIEDDDHSRDSRKKTLLEAENKESVRPLGIAAGNGHTTIVEMLLARGADIDATEGWSSGNMKALSRAAENGHVGVVDILLKHGASAESSDAWTAPLAVAAKGGHLGVVELLLGGGADPNSSVYDSNHTPLCEAAKSDSEAVVRRLLVAGARDLDLALEKATEKSNEAVAKILLSKGASPERAPGHRSSYYKAPLLEAAQLGNAPIVRMLLNQGAGCLAPEQPATSDWQRALFLAAGKGHASVIELLVAPNDNGSGSGSLGHLINVQDESGWTPLIHAAQVHEGRSNSSNDGAAVARTLLAAGADCNAVTYEGSTALCKAVLEKHVHSDSDDATATARTELVKQLLDAGADPDLGRDGKTKGTALVLATKGGHGAAIVEMLIAAGADVEARDSKGMTPLLLAAVDGNVEVILALIEKGGAEVEAEDKKRRTALSWAGWNRHTEAAKLLLENGADETEFIGRKPQRSQHRGFGRYGGSDFDSE
ncbi:ankyrin [Ophiobolus disseminans]|uniref:Ankyrin n=1 Tax=Ophiobolus disseminans TaxID=1469910 RepID=A0A6A6ZDI5_9PLEO|nr:ankyrin [Ophiobolus disseminans]